jgi:hypothetical protein
MPDQWIPLEAASLPTRLTGTVDFWDLKTRYTLTYEREGVWALHGHFVADHATHLATLERDGERWWLIRGRNRTLRGRDWRVLVDGCM